MEAQPQTWHYGLMARWWAEFNVATHEELAFFRAQITAAGEPALDLACGAGRIMLPLLEEGFEVDGCDLSADMLEQCRSLAAAKGHQPQLFNFAMHKFEVPARYHTIYICDSFGLGGQREHDREALRRCHDALEPGGRLVFNNHQPYGNPLGWQLWLEDARKKLRTDWPANGKRRRTADGNELELHTRVTDFDPVEQRITMESRVGLWRDGALVDQDQAELQETLYFRNELLLMLEMAGFAPVDVYGGYDSRPAARGDAILTFVATKHEVT